MFSRPGQSLLISFCSTVFSWITKFGSFLTEIQPVLLAISTLIAIVGGCFAIVGYIYRIRNTKLQYKLNYWEICKICNGKNPEQCPYKGDPPGGCPYRNLSQ